MINYHSTIFRPRKNMCVSDNPTDHVDWPPIVKKNFPDILLKQIYGVYFLTFCFIPNHFCPFW